MSVVGDHEAVAAVPRSSRQYNEPQDEPTLILHGDADRILPADATSRRQAKLIKDVKLVELPGGPHGVLWTHADQINAELVSFLG